MKRKVRVQFVWFLSYLLILIMPILIGFVIYRVAMENSRKQAEIQNNSSMMIIKNELDNQLMDGYTTLNRIAFNRSVQVLSSSRQSFSSEEQYQLYGLYQELNDTEFSEQYGKGIFIYFKNMDYIVSSRGNMDFELYYRLFYHDRDIAEEELREYLMEKHFHDILLVSKEDNREELLFVTSTLRSELGENSATIGIRLDVDRIDDLVNVFKWDEKIRLFLINEDNQIINNETTEGIEEILDYDSLKEEENFDINIEGTAYLASVMSSEQTSWKYVLLVPREILEKNPRMIQRISIIGLFICLIVGFCLSYYLTRRNYNPLKNLIAMFKKNERSTGAEDIQNEFQWLEKQAGQIFREWTDARQVIHQNGKILKNYYLLRLMEYPYSEERAADVAAYYKELSAAPYHIVILFSFGMEEKNDGEDYVKKNGLNKFIVTNIFTEVIGEHFYVETTELGEEVATVVNMQNGSEEELMQLKEIIENTQQFLFDRWYLCLIAAFGNQHAGMEGIHDSYLEARETQEYSSLLEADSILYRDIRNMHKKYFYPIEREESIINAIKAQDSRSACEYIYRVLRINYAENKISGNLRKCLLFDMTATIYKGMEEAGCCKEEEIDILKEMSSRMSLDEVMDLFRDCVERICSQSLEKRAGQDLQLSESVKKYIQENYQNPDLNISQTGLVFHLTPSYLSAIFKEQTGSSLLVYINSVRMDKARELLEQGESVADTAEQVGFRDSGSFIRVFKKHMGITPGQMKKNGTGR